MKRICIAMLVFGFFFLCRAPLWAAEQPVVAEVRQKVAEEFARLDAALKDAARKLRLAGLTGEGARSALAELCGGFAYAVDCAAVDAAGRMVTVEPPPFRHVEGTDISDQPQVKQVIRTRRPVMSPVFRAVEGFDAVDLEYPVVARKGRYLGSVSLLFKPERLFAQLLPPLLKGIPVDIWGMDETGRILYDADAPQIGQNLFTSPLYRAYPQLLKLGHRIASAPEGRGSYRYRVRNENRVATKRAYWKTVSLYGTEWRIVGVHVEQGESGVHSRQTPSVIEPEERLAAFAAEADLLQALAAGDSAQAMRLLKGFYDATPGIYAIQWIDENGVNRFGYPAGNSLTDYDYHQRRFPRDQAILDLLKSRRKATWEAPLIEGGVAGFTFVPLLEGNRYLGMVYTIRMRRLDQSQ